MSDNCRALSHTDGSTGPHTDCEDVWIRTENPWLINDESGNFQEEVSSYFELFSSSYLCCNPLLRDNTDLASSFLVVKHHLRSSV